MSKKLTDTNPEAEKVLIELFKNASVSKKLNCVFSMSAFVISLSKRATERAYPDLSEMEKKLLFVKYHYGEELYNRVKKFSENQKKISNQ